MKAELRKGGPGPALCDELDEVLARHDLPPLSYATRCAILVDLRFPAVSLSVADLPLDKSLIGKAAASGGGLSWWLGPGVVVGLVGGGVAGYAMAKRDKAERDVAQTRQSIARAVAEVVAALPADGTAILAMVVAGLGAEPTAPPLDLDHARKLKAMEGHLRFILQQSTAGDPIPISAAVG